MKEKIKKINTKRILLTLIAISLLLLLISSKSMRGIFFVMFFVVANVFATLYKRYFYLPVEFEIISLGIVLCSYTYGIGAGLAVALIGGAAYTIFCTSFSPFTVPMLFGYCLMAAIAAYVPIGNIVFLGILANIIHNIFIFLVYHFFFGYDIWKNFLYSASNILFNVLLFWNLGNILMKLMG